MNILKNMTYLFYIFNIRVCEFIKYKMIYPVKRYLIYDYISELSEIIQEPEMINIYYTGYKLLLNDNITKLFNTYYKLIDDVNANLIKIELSDDIKNILIQINNELKILSHDNNRSHSYLKETLLPQLFKEILIIFNSDEDFMENIREYFIELLMIFNNNNDFNSFMLEIYKILLNNNNSVKKLRKLLNIDEIILMKFIKYLKD
ncbi:hypothetical protein MYSEV_262 [Mythimna separata entomopoxvirus 'L']|uniref:Uncharacterized protein n=1 Tax=Mythimna separata entomopoxvirus 'L' TaxID=1293572 RepID=A0A916KQZ0_9POXV|nr:hypothetical protein MYSEV_262 [Mythimna separata entomopoxvirus 'L']CCU56460.1 hypothetical protein MYSEV_262 [Mythimna separata entomopoxvirus 'L']